MKRFWIGVCVMGLVLAGAAPAFAGGTINKSNLSPEYMGSYTRNASTDHADIVAYNPAGTVKLEDGLTLNLGLQYLIEKDYTNNFIGTRDAYTGTEYETTEPSAIPSLYTVYKTGPMAAFFSVNVPVGGGKVDYEDGNFVTYSVAQNIRAQANAAVYTNPLVPPPALALLAATYGASPLTSTGPYSVSSHRIDAESYGVGYTLGGAYQFNDMFSASAGIRYIDSKVDMAGSARLRLDPNLPAPLAALGLAPSVQRNIAFDAEAKGWGGIFGLDIYPSDKVTIGLRFETPTRLEYEYDVSEGASILSALNIVQGGKARDDLPGTFGAGVGYQMTDRFRGEVNLTYYFNEGSDIGGTTLRPGLENTVNDGYEIGISGSYLFTENLKASLGYLYTSIGVNPEDSSKFLPDLDSHALGVGLQWTLVKNLDLTFAAGNVFYVSDSYVDNSLVAAGIETQPTTVEFNKNIPYVGFGVQYKFF